MDAQNTSNVNPQDFASLFHSFQTFLKQKSLIAKKVLPKITDQQYAKLVEYMESNGDLGHRDRHEPRWLNDKMWHDLTNGLNSMSETDPNKLIRMSRHWKATWRTLKQKVDEKQTTNQPLTALEERVLAIMVRPGNYQAGVYQSEPNVQSMASEEVVLEMDPESIFNDVMGEDEVLPSSQPTSHIRAPSPDTEQIPSTSKQMLVRNQTSQQSEQTTLQLEQTPPIASKQTTPQPEQMPPRAEEIAPRPEEISQPDVMPSTSQVPPATPSIKTRPNNTDSNRVSPNNVTSRRMQRPKLKPVLWNSADFVSYNCAESRLKFEKLREKNRHEREMRRLDLDSRRLGVDEQLTQALNRLAETTAKFIQKFG